MFMIMDLIVSGCTNPAVCGFVRGAYKSIGENHGKKAYKKDVPPGLPCTFLYYWDTRDGQEFSGWYFGPQVGSDIVFAHHKNSNTDAPPNWGWQVPFAGFVDRTLQVAWRALTTPRKTSGTRSLTRPWRTGKRIAIRRD